MNPLYFEGARLLCVVLFHKRLTGLQKNVNTPVLANHMGNTGAHVVASLLLIYSILYEIFPWLPGQVGVNNSPLVDIGAVRQEGQTLWKSLPFLV